MKMKPIRKATLALTILMVLTLVLTACAAPSQGGTTATAAPAATAKATQPATPAPQANAWQGDPNLNELGMLPICKETVALTVAIPQGSVVENWDTCYQTVYIEETANFDLQFEIFPTNEYSQQLTLMVTAGGDDLPDVILSGLSDTRAYLFGLAGAIIPLNDYLEHSNYYINEAIERTGVNFMEMVTSPDGNIYALPVYNQSIVNEYPARFFIYQPWLDKLGFEKPNTTEELYQVLKAFRTEDPNGNGKADEIPTVCYKGRWDGPGLIKILMMPFQKVQVNGWYTVENGEVYFAPTTDGFRDGIRYIRRLVSEDLLSPLTFTQDEKQLGAMTGGETTIVGLLVRQSLDGSLFSATDPRRAEYEGMPPLLSQDGTSRYALYAPTVANPAGAISKNCKTPEAAYRFLEYLCSEEISIMTRFGEKGVDWLEPAPGEKSMFEAMGYPATLKFVSPLWASPQNKWWAQVGPYVRQYSIAAGMVWDGNELNNEYLAAKILPEYMGRGPEEVIPKFIFTDEEEKQIAEMATVLNDYIKESVARFAVGELDVEKDWDNFQSELKALGIDTVTQVYQAVYDRMYKK